MVEEVGTGTPSARILTSPHQLQSFLTANGHSEGNGAHTKVRAPGFAAGYA